MLEIRLAEAREFADVRSFYHSMIDAMRDARYKPGWEKGVYPADDYLRDSIRDRTLYTGLLDGRIVSSMIVNHSCNESYAGIQKWLTDAAPGEVTVIHALGVHPDFAGRGLAKEMVAKAISVAAEQGQKAVRLDVLGGNLPAEKLYTSLGFQYIDTLQMFYEDTGWTDFKLYEYPLPK